MRRRNGRAHTQRILAAAVAEFARSGRDGARIDAIAKSAGLNKRLLYQHVGDKAALFDAALEACLSHLVSGAADGVTSNEQAWRLLGHAAALGVPLDLAPLLAALRRPGESEETFVNRVGLDALAGLLPQLLDGLLNNHDGVAGRKRLLTDFQQRTQAGLDPAAKPRVKLRPAIRPA